MYSKQIVLDYLWQHSRFYHSCLYQSEELYREEKGIACVMVLFSCMENISKSVINDFDTRSVDIYKTLFAAGIISTKEHEFLNVGDFCIRKIRNFYAHANVAAIYMVDYENDVELYCPLTDDATSLLLYEKISDILFNLILKIVSSVFIDEIKNKLCIVLDEAISACSLKFQVMSVKQLLVLKGFPENYFDKCEDIPEHAKIRLLDNAPDVGLMTEAFSVVKKMMDDGNP